MIQTVCEHPALTWVDVVAPAPEELKEIAARYGLHPTSVNDCLDPRHLPKFEKLDGRLFFIVRHLDDEALENPSADSVTELTRKLAVFVSDKFLLTVHRSETALFSALRDYWARPQTPPPDGPMPIVLSIVREAIVSFEPALSLADDAFDAFEIRIFNNLTSDGVLEEVYFLKRRVSVYKRLIRHTLDVVTRFQPEGRAAPFFQDVKEEAERMLYWADESLEDIHSLIHSHLSLASHRTNEIIRVLTLFSVFFLPLTFIVGVYGMNFRFMPELEWKWGYPVTWAAMGGITLGIFMWFRRKGWLR